MDLGLVSEVWKILNNYIPNRIEQRTAADEIVQYLIDNDVSIDDIKVAFDGESAFMKVIKDYDKDESFDIEEDTDWEDDDNDTGYGNVEW
jgi:hypothetical protein